MICHCRASREERAAAYKEALEKGLLELIGYIKKQRANGDQEAALVLQHWDITRP
jgi:hypothetical protein